MYEDCAFQMVDPKDGGSYTYYAKPDGALCAGRWKQNADGEWYYFGTDGYMVTGRYIDGWWIDADGVCR